MEVKTLWRFYRVKDISRMERSDMKKTKVQHD